MSPAELRTKYQEVFGEATRSGNKHFLVKRLAWRLQSEAEGGLSERARRRAAELARDADIRTTMPRAPQKSIGPASQPVASRIARSSSLPMPGTVLTRQYKGRTIEVTVLANGVEWDGQVYRSLTAVAKAITGSHWNGRLFFGLKNGDAQ
jgi:hypothetical protein